MSELPSQIVDLSDFDESINLLVYGPSGVGKTVFGGSGSRVLYLAVEKGTVSARRQGSKAKVWPVNEWDDLEAAYVWLEENPDAFDWVVLDSITEMQQMAIRAILKKANEENSSRDLDIPAIQDHQKWQNIYKRFINYFVELPVNCLFIALVRTAQDEDKNEFLTPDIQGKNYQLSQYTCGQMSAYGYMNARKVALKDENGDKVLGPDGKAIPQIVRRITWMDTGVIRGKDRYSVLEPFTEDVSLAEVHDLIDGEVTREELGQFIRPTAPGKKAKAKSSQKAKAKESQPKESKSSETSSEEKNSSPEEPTAEPDDDGFGEKSEVEAAKSDEAKREEDKADESKDSESDPSGDEWDLDGDFDF